MESKAIAISWVSSGSDHYITVFNKWEGVNFKRVLWEEFGTQWAYLERHVVGRVGMADEEAGEALSLVTQAHWWLVDKLDEDEGFLHSINDDNIDEILGEP